MYLISTGVKSLSSLSSLVCGTSSGSLELSDVSGASSKMSATESLSEDQTTEMQELPGSLF